MITLNIQKYCDNCPEFEPEVDKTYLGTCDGKTKFHSTLITCAHQDRCHEMVKYLKQK